MCFNPGVLTQLSRISARYEGSKRALLLLSWALCLVGVGALADGPAESRFLRFLVLEADVAVVAEFAAAGDPFAEGEGAGSGSAAAGGVVGDLDVAEVLGVVLDDGFDVVAVDCQVVEVGEELDVLCAGFCLDAGDDLECVFGGEERVLGCAADRFEEDGAADAGDAFRCCGEVLGGEFVLLFRGELVLAVAVEGVEGLAARRSPMPATTSMLSLNSEQRPFHETRPRSPPGMLPALKFRPVS